ncbi:MAG: peptide ABC transporter substrate-binding protein [Chloroflexota bacterium]|nr:peptide ABC transporter substrate-binding protein [Chloroflexota bacterium]
MATKLSRRRFLVLGSATALAVACAPSTGGAPGASASAGGGAAGAPQKGGSLTFALDSDISDLDPMLSALFVDRNIHYQMYDSLVRINAKGEIVPGLATKWTTSSDGKTVTFDLRQGVKYQDGTTFDAASVKWNLDRYRQKGSHRTGELAPVESVDVVDDHTVKVTLKTAFAPFLSILVDRAGMMVSQKVADAMGKDFTVHPYKAGTGPFVLTEAVKSDHYTLTRNPDYWEKDQGGNALPYLDSITFKPILDPNVRLTNVRTGQAQVLTRMSGKDIPTVKSDSTLTFVQTSAYGWDSMIPNRSPGALFSEARYVKAVSMAIDRDQLLNDGPAKGVGAVAYGPYAPSHFCYDPSFKPFAKADPAGAKKLIDDVGKGPLTFELLVPSGSPDTLQLAQLIQSQLKTAGITMNIKTELFNQIVKISEQHQQPGMSLYGWSGRIDPDQNTYDFVVTGQPNNDSAYSNPQVDQLMKQQRTETDQAKRKTDLQKAQQIFAVDDPSRVWYDFAASILLTAKAVQGLEAYPDQIARLGYGWLKK